MCKDQPKYRERCAYRSSGRDAEPQRVILQLYSLMGLKLLGGDVLRTYPCFFSFSPLWNGNVDPMLAGTSLGSFHRLIAEGKL